jgi:hypothetical protein
MLLLPDKSRLDFYKHVEKREAKRENNKVYQELRKKENQLMNVFRIDHLSRIQN